MQCKVCPNEQMVLKKLDVPIWKDGKFVIVEDVMGYECASCGERIFNKETTHRILDALNKKAERFVKTAVYSIHEENQ